VAKVPTREIRNCRRVRTTSGEPLPAGSDRTGRKDLTRQIPTGNGWNGPAMRPKHPHAAESGVGKYTARESEAPNCVPSGKSAWRTPTPKFGPGTARFRGLIVFEMAVRGLRFASREGRNGREGKATSDRPPLRNAVTYRSKVAQAQHCPPLDDARSRAIALPHTDLQL